MNGRYGSKVARRALSLSLDLDNLWSYQKVRGDKRWEELGSYLEPLSEIVVEALARHGLQITFFVVGQDAALERNHQALRRIAEAGHEISNHSFHHEPWLHRYSDRQLREELSAAEEAIEAATGQRVVGFRGPGYSLSEGLLRELGRRGYEYDASTLPTFIGPLARAYYFRRSGELSEAMRQERGKLFGTLGDGLRPLKPYCWDTGHEPVIEIPVTTMPGPRTPFHMSYLLYLASYSQALALLYLRLALAACRLRGIEPSFLLHPLDFLGSDQVQELSFFPGMALSTSSKIEFFDRVVGVLVREFEVLTIREHARRVRARARVRVVDSKAAGRS